MGRARFSICMSQLLPPDLSPYFRGALSIFAQVTAQDGSQFIAYDDTMPVSRQKIDIEYTEDTRAHFKPGIPFKGKVGVLHCHVTISFVKIHCSRFKPITSTARALVMSQSC